MSQPPTQFHLNDQLDEFEIILLTMFHAVIVSDQYGDKTWSEKSEAATEAALCMLNVIKKYRRPKGTS